MPRYASLVLGWREWVALPEFGLWEMKAKVDTGACSAALHAEDIEVLDDGGEDDSSRGLARPLLRFTVPRRADGSEGVTVVARSVGYRGVTDSGGHREKRHFIRSRLHLGGGSWEIEISLASRRGLRHRLILGRESLPPGALVRPDRSFLAAKSAEANGKVQMPNVKVLRA